MIFNLCETNKDKTMSDIAREYGVMSIPCLILFEDNKEIKRNIGFIPESKLKEFIK